MAVVKVHGHTPEETVARGDVWHLEQQGNLLAVAVKRAILPELPDAPRSEIVEFTRASRLRLLKLLARVDWDRARHCLFITLTYPDECIDWDQGKRTQHRNQLMRDLKKHYGYKPSALWRVEWVQRQSGALKGQIAPHMHLCLFETGWLPKAKLRKWWGRIIGHKEPLCWVRFRKGIKAAEYAAKYAAKEECMGGLANSAYLNGKANGRRWGASGRGAIPLCPQRYIMGLSPAEQAQAEALGEQHLGLPHKGGYVILSDDAADLFDRVMGIGNTPIAVGDAWE